MPQIEIHADVPGASGRCETAVQSSDAFADQIADCVADAFEVAAQVVGVFFVEAPARDASHAVAPRRACPRVFVKVHAIGRSPTLRKKLAGMLSSVLAGHYAIDPACIAIYFFDRAADEIAYGGSLMTERV